MACPSRGASPGPRPPRALATAAALAALALACGGSPAEPPGGPPAFKLSGIGDSMMQGANASAPGEQLQNSFAQGTSPSVNSIFSRYQALGLLAGGKEFVSVSGAQMVGGTSNAAVQAGRICQQVKPDRIVLLLGANDVCNRATVAGLYPVDTFRTALKAALDALGAPACGLPAGSRVHVLSVPRVDRLRAAGLAKDAIWGLPVCQALWSIISICTIVTRETDPAVLAQVGARIDAYNDALAAEVAAADAAHGGLAGVHFTTDWVGTTRGTSADTYPSARRTSPTWTASTHRSRRSASSPASPGRPGSSAPGRSPPACSEMRRVVGAPGEARWVRDAGCLDCPENVRQLVRLALAAPPT
jgi:hypothetical protein